VDSFVVVEPTAPVLVSPPALAEIGYYDTLSWDVPYDAAGPFVYRFILSRDSTFASDTVRYTNFSAEAFLLNDFRSALPEDQPLYWKVRVEMGDTVVSPWSATGSFRIMANAVAGAAGRGPSASMLTARVLDNGGQVAVMYGVAVAGRYRLSVYNLAGTLVRTLLDSDLGPGGRQSLWDRRDSRGRTVSAGQYVVKLASPVHEWTTSVLLH
jgi:hypothetical protein